MCICVRGDDGEYSLHFPFLKFGMVQGRMCNVGQEAVILETTSGRNTVLGHSSRLKKLATFFFFFFFAISVLFR